MDFNLTLVSARRWRSVASSVLVPESFVPSRNYHKLIPPDFLEWRMLGILTRNFALRYIT